MTLEGALKCVSKYAQLAPQKCFDNDIYLFGKTLTFHSAAYPPEILKMCCESAN